MEPPSISFGESHRPDLHLLPAEIAGFLCLLKRSRRLKEHRSVDFGLKLARAVPKFTIAPRFPAPLGPESSKTRPSCHFKVKKHWLTGHHHLHHLQIPNHPHLC